MVPTTKHSQAPGTRPLAADEAAPGAPQSQTAGALLGNLDSVLRHATGLAVSIADEPLSCVALGTGRCLEEMSVLKRVLYDPYEY